MDKQFRKTVIAGNWKMNKTPSEAKAFALAASEMVDYAVAHDIDVGVAPTFVCLQTVKENINSKCIVAAQNVNEHDHGAYTGEVSIPMLKEIGIGWVILGHSERRAYNGETSEKCNEKIKALLAVFLLNAKREILYKPDTITEQLLHLGLPQRLATAHSTTT